MLTAGVITDHAAGIDIDAFAGGELAFDHAAAGMDEHPAIALQLLHDEALAAEQAGEDLLLQVHADLHAARAGQEAVLLADDLAADARPASSPSPCPDMARRRRPWPCRCHCACTWW
jgi:hypothetical protein